MSTWVPAIEDNEQNLYPFRDRLERRGRAIPSILVTSCAMSRSCEQAFAAGRDACVETSSPGRA